MNIIKDEDINVKDIKEAIKTVKNIKRVNIAASFDEQTKILNAIKIVLESLNALCDMKKSANIELKKAREINEEHKKINRRIKRKSKRIRSKIRI